MNQKVHTVKSQYNYSVADIFKSIQGEGSLLGIPMVFIRLAGCSLNCSMCDTNHVESTRYTAKEINKVISKIYPDVEWTWITGGEPTEQNLLPLTKLLGGKIALATNGMNPIDCEVDFLSVSPHKTPDELNVERGDQLNLVPGLNGLKLSDWEGFKGHRFKTKWVTPFWYGPKDRAERVEECIEWVDTHEGWKLGIQAHKTWGLE